MKLIMENWRGYLNEEERFLQEQEFEQFFNEHFTIIDENVIGDFVRDVVRSGRRVKDTVVNVIAGIKDWTHEKIVNFVKYMGDKFKQFIEALRAKGIFKKYRARAEMNAVTLLMTNKHIDLAVMIFSALAKLTGGFIVDKVVKTPEIIKKVLEFLEDPLETFKDLVGDVSDIVKMVKKFIDYRKDRGTHAAAMGTWDDFGGLAEKLGG